MIKQALGAACLRWPVAARAAGVDKMPQQEKVTAGDKAAGP